MLRAIERAIDAADIVAGVKAGRVVLTKNRFGQTRAFQPDEFASFLNRTAKQLNRPITMVWTEETIP